MAMLIFVASIGMLVACAAIMSPRLKLRQWLALIAGLLIMGGSFGFAMKGPAWSVYIKHWLHPDRADQFGRLREYPGKILITCPAQDPGTAVLLLIGQSNAANYQGERYQSPDDQVVNFSDGQCYRAASPLLGADGDKGEPWTLLGRKLIDAGLYHTVILVPAAVGGTAVDRWSEGGDLAQMLLTTVRTLAPRYRITAVLWDQGSEDFMRKTSEASYRANLGSLIAWLRIEGVKAPFFVTRCSFGYPDWTDDNPVARAQADVLDDQNNVFSGPDTDHTIAIIDRFDGWHFGARGQQSFTDDWVKLLRKHVAESRITNK